MWYAKPQGGYDVDSAEGRSNQDEIYAYFSARGYSTEAISGICGNINAESGFNPWRWQRELYNLNAGYGLFQCTPAREYIEDCTGVTYYAPNLSPTSVTPGAQPSDGIAQLEVFHTNRLRKWMSGCWRNYWDPSEYPSEYALRARILNTWGNGSSLSMAQFAAINAVEAATFAFLACFEGPNEIHLSGRVVVANNVYEYLSGHPPVPPPTPTMIRKKYPVFLYRKGVLPWQ